MGDVASRVHGMCLEGVIIAAGLLNRWQPLKACSDDVEGSNLGEHSYVFRFSSVWQDHAVGIAVDFAY